MASAVDYRPVPDTSGAAIPRADSPAHPALTVVTTLGLDSAKRTAQLEHHGGADEPSQDLASSTLSADSVTSPPYWHNRNAHTHQRTASSFSVDSHLPVGAITLRDNETGDHSDRNDACWAKGVEIMDHTVVNGSATNIGAFVVWNVRVQTLSVRTSVALVWCWNRYPYTRIYIYILHPSLFHPLPQFPRLASIYLHINQG